MNSGGVARDGSHATLTKTTFYQIPATMSRFGSFQADQSKIGFKVDGAQFWYYLAERNGINSLSGLGLKQFYCYPISELFLDTCVWLDCQNCS